MKYQHGLLREEGDTTVCMMVKKNRQMAWTEYLPFIVLGVMLIGMLVMFI